MSIARRAELEAARAADPAAARGLPNACYTSAAAFDEERRSVLFAHWSGVGFGKDVPLPGDVRPIEFLGMPLLLVRGDDGEVSVFQNTCRHRGMILVEEPTSVRKVIRCPYHSWCYALDGALVATPHVGGAGDNAHAAIRPDELGLFRVRSHVWRDVVFVDVSGEAAPFEEANRALLERWSELEQPIRHGGPSSSFTLDVRTNWKLAVENYCESYHLPWIHPGLNSYSRLQDHYDVLDDAADNFSGQGTCVYRRLRDEDGRAFPEHENLSAKWEEGAEYVALYPNVLLGVHRDHSFAIVLEPREVERTAEHVAIYYTEEAAADPALAAMRDANAALWQGVFEEDIGVVEGMQRGRHGPLFDGGRFSPAMDASTHRFHAWMAGRLLAGRENAGDGGTAEEGTRASGLAIGSSDARVVPIAVI